MPSNPHPDAKPPVSAAKAFGFLVLVAALAAATWWLLETGVRVGHTVEWECWGGECSTDDARSLLPIAGIICNAALAVAMVKAARLLGWGLAAMVGPLAALSGWDAAVAAGLPPAEVATERGVVGAALVVAAVIALLGLLIELKTTGFGARLLGAQRVPAVLSDFRPADAPIGRIDAENAAKHGFGTAALTFTHNGSRHSVRVRTHRKWVGHAPVFAVFRETRPERARVALPWFRTAADTEGNEVTQESAPPTESHRGSASLVSELERLATLHSAGHLTQDEFEAAKRRLLDE
ncbi:SHOCT domain-containing protein [Glycomyces albidus]|uniref:SHOCT domain-containing protein n=1 Tax=Glycomyces albidus TaxID=2656774 RepID=A0A6L5GDL4_9ACTN|nr:SHOCT domain-containing protein [Glycomyces albidus]MQM27770.1 hypothetical protein [Glycomyces albidus]